MAEIGAYTAAEALQAVLARDRADTARRPPVRTLTVTGEGSIGLRMVPWRVRSAAEDLLAEVDVPPPAAGVDLDVAESSFGAHKAVCPAGREGQKGRPTTFWCASPRTYSARCSESRL